MFGFEQDEESMVKVAAMAAIGTASLLGAVPPVLRRRTRSPAREGESYYLVRAFTSGILLSLAFIHVIADGFEKLEGLSGDIPAAPILVLAGIMLMFVVERARCKRPCREGAVSVCGESGGV